MNTEQLKTAVFIISMAFGLLALGSFIIDLSTGISHICSFIFLGLEATCIGILYLIKTS